MPAGKRIKPRTTRPPTSRASISFPPKLYETLEEIAKKKKVSIAWVVRDATEIYVAERSPLLGKTKGNREQ